MAYPGGKGNVYQKIINQIPPHRVYIETHAGEAAVARHKRPARQNILIDLDPEVLATTRYQIATNGDEDQLATSKMTMAIIAQNDDAPAWQFVCSDAVEWLQSYNFRGDEFVYADPPYLMETRRQQRQLYRYEYSETQHIELLTCLKRLPCPVMVSGYWSELYADLLAGWRSESFEAWTRGNTPATEYLWMNYPKPLELHDYAHLGNNFRERERIKRKKARWVKRLRKMPLLERQAILAAIASIYDDAHNSF